MYKHIKSLGINKNLAAISNHASMLGGGEYSFFDFICRLDDSWKAIAVVPSKGELYERLIKKNIKTEIIPLEQIRPRFILNFLKGIINLCNLFQKHNVSLIYCNGSRASIYGGITGQILGIPVIWHCRIDDRDPYLDFFLSIIVTRIIANSRSTAKRFLPVFQKKINVIYNGLDIEWLKDKSVQKPEIINKEWQVVLVVARVSRLKRHDLAISAFESAAESNPFLNLVLVGGKDKLDSQWWKILQDITGKSAFVDRIHWIGDVRDIRPWYRSANIMLLPSISESFGRVLIEAMANGIPVIANRVGGIPEIITHGKDGLLCTPFDINEMSQAIEFLLCDSLLKKEIIISAKKRAEYFNIDRHLFEMTKVFYEIL